jgi:hypothetical protein
MGWTVVFVCFKILDIDPQDQLEEDGGHTDLDSQRKGKCVVIKTSTRQVCLLQPTANSFPCHSFSLALTNTHRVAVRDLDAVWVTYLSLSTLLLILRLPVCPFALIS